MDFAADADNNTIQTTVMADEQAQKWIEGKTPKKVIIVPKKNCKHRIIIDTILRCVKSSNF